MRVVYVIFLFLLCSCGTTFNRKETSVTVHNIPKDVVIKPKMDYYRVYSKQNNDAVVVPKRSVEPLRLVLNRNNDSNDNVLVIRSTLGFNPEDVYLDTNAIFHHKYQRTDLYAGGDNKMYHTVKRDTSHKLKLLVSIAALNQYNFSTDKFIDPNQSNISYEYARTGYLAYSIGLEKKLNKNNAAVINFSYNPRLKDFGKAFGSYATESYTNLFLGVNHTFPLYPRFSVLGGLSWYTYKYDLEYIDPNEASIPGEIAGNVKFSGLGVQAGLQYQLNQNSFLAFNDMFALMPLSKRYKNSFFNYCAIEFVIKPNIFKSKMK